MDSVLSVLPADVVLPGTLGGKGMLMLGSAKALCMATLLLADVVLSVHV